MQTFCTYFDENYLSSGLALYQSLRRNCEDFTLYVLCMDEVSLSAMEQLDLASVELISLETIERADPEMHATKNDRSLVEYYFTVHSSYPLYVLETYGPDRVTYLDADLYFYSSLELLFDEIGDASIAIHPHRFPPGDEEMERFGLYNGGFGSFKSDTEGISCLESWRRDAIEWCKDRVEGDRFANQKYLEKWPEEFENVRVIDHPGVGLAPWNHDTHIVTRGDETILVDGKPLIFYHFSRLKQIHPRIWWPPMNHVTDVEKRDIYVPYIKELLAQSSRLSNHTGISNVSKGTVRDAGLLELESRSLMGLLKKVVQIFKLSRSLLLRDLIYISDTYKPH